MPSAMSRAIEPVGMTFMATSGLSPRRMTEPLPNCLSIWARAMSRALSRSSVAMVFTFGEVAWSGSGSTLGRGADSSGRTTRPVEGGPACGRTLDRTSVRSPRRHATRPTRPENLSAQLRRHLELLADGQPHAPDGQSGVDRVHRAAPAQGGEHVVPGDGLGPHRAEVVGQAGPELLQSHASDANAPRGPRAGPPAAAPPPTPPPAGAPAPRRRRPRARPHRGSAAARPRGPPAPHPGP